MRILDLLVKERINLKLQSSTKSEVIKEIAWSFEETKVLNHYDDFVTAVNAREALSSTALEEGIVPGGGIIYYQLHTLIKDLSSDNKAIQAGIDIVRESLLEPIKKLLSNAGEDIEYVLSELKREDKKNYGYDVETEKFGDMFELGIIDPAKVTRNAIQNSTSVAAQILTTEAVVCEIPEEKDSKSTPMV